MKILKKIKDGERGIALLLVLSIGTLAFMASLEFNKNVRGYLSKAAESKNDTMLSQLNIAAVDIGISMIAKDMKADLATKKEIDSVQEDWANPQKIQEALAELSFEHGKIDSLEITDEMGKIQINALVALPKGQNFDLEQKKLWESFLSSLVPHSSLKNKLEPSLVINPVKDWLDHGEGNKVTGLTGAEEEYYKNQNLNYFGINSAFSNLGEFLRVRGVESFFGSIGAFAKIEENMTVFGAEKASKDKYSYTGKININTAPVSVLTVLLSGGTQSEKMKCANKMAEYRVKKTSNSKEAKFLNSLEENWYKNIPDCALMEINNNWINLSSKYFKIVSKASFGDEQVTTVAIVHREKDKKNKWKHKIVYWKSK